MKINMGMGDRVVRVILSGLLVAGFSAGIVSGPISFVMPVLAGVFAITGLVGFCPLYSIFGLKTN